MKNNKWKNYSLWTAFFAFIPILAQALKAYDLNLIIPDNYDELVIAFLAVLVCAGIVSNPSIGKGFKDKGVK